MEYVYPAIFHKNEDGSYSVIFPDLPGCISEGKNLANALFLAQSALKQWIGYMFDEKQHISRASSLEDIEVSDGEFVNLVCADVSNRAVRRTISIPKWMDDKVVKSGLSLSKVLQEALIEKFA